MRLLNCCRRRLFFSGGWDCFLERFGTQMPASVVPLAAAANRQASPPLLLLQPPPVPATRYMWLLLLPPPELCRVLSRHHSPAVWT